MPGPNLDLTEEHQMIRDTARDFAQNEIAPIAAHFDETGEFPRETIKKMGALGLMGIEVPEEYGGAGTVLNRLPVVIQHSRDEFHFDTDIADLQRPIKHLLVVIATAINSRSSSRLDVRQSDPKPNQGS